MNQNDSENAITVPHTGSQKQLYRKVLHDSGIAAHAVTYVEAHGTGTPVGDPREMSSIREVFGGFEREDKLYIGSIKGNIGHLEAASGIASIIKTLLMMRYQLIPPAASFDALNPRIPDLEADKLGIARAPEPWQPKSDFRIACINNYGASGNNSAMLLTQGQSQEASARPANLSTFPIHVSGKDEAAVKRNCEAIAGYLEISDLALKDVAYELSRTQSRVLPQAFTAKSSSTKELCNQLRQATSVLRPPKTKPVVLAFGGQSSTFVGLNRHIFETTAVVRHYVLQCDRILRDSGLGGVVPAIFQNTPIEDIVTLHACFFAMQYATAMAWISSGLKVDALVGHSFGQLTALVVSGTLSLQDGLKLVTGRARIMEEYWGPIRGAMISVEAKTETVTTLIEMVRESQSSSSLEIACYNGPAGHTLVGHPEAVEAADQLVASRKEELSGAKARKLNVTHGFHSVFTDPLLPAIVELGTELDFNNSPAIHLETSSKYRSWPKVTPERLAEHTRTPVYFRDAVDRLAERLGPSTWIEAGTGSSVTGIVRKALGSGQAMHHSFESVQLHKPEAVASLVEVTLRLWQGGSKVQFWPFNRLQSDQYVGLDLPLYQFKKSRHWIPYVDHGTGVNTASSLQPQAGDSPLVQFTRFLDDKRTTSEFLINKAEAGYQLSTKGHAVLDQPLTPAGEYVELAVRAAALASKSSDPDSMLWTLNNVSTVSPLGSDEESQLKLVLESKGRSQYGFQLLNESKAGEKLNTSVHGRGNVTIHSSLEDAERKKELLRTSRLISTDRFHDVFSNSAAESLRGSLIYRLFSKVVGYADFYKGLRSVASTADDVAARIELPPHSIPALNQSVVNSLAIDNILQVAGINVNCLKPCADTDVYVCTGIDRVAPGDSYHKAPSDRPYLVYSTFSRHSEREVSNDIYVFDETTEELCMSIYGVRFTRVPTAALARTIGRSNSQPTQNVVKPGTTRHSASHGKASARSPMPASSRKAQSASDLHVPIKDLINSVAGVPVDQMEDKTTLDDAGIDSLMIHELRSEFKKVFEVEVNSPDIGAWSISDLASHVSKHSTPVNSTTASYDVSDASSSSGNSSRQGGQSTPASSVSDPPSTAGGDFQKLAKLVSEQLGVTSSLSPDVALGDIGMDSLLSIELAHDIEEAFGVHLEPGFLNGGTTFGELCERVVPGPIRTAPVSADALKTKLDSETKPSKPPRRGKIDMQTVLWKECDDGTKLYADIYLPGTRELPKEMSVGMTSG